MSKAPHIADAEWKVMQAVWQRCVPPRAGRPAPEDCITASEIVDMTAVANHWSPRTVKTLINRLAKRGVLGHRQEGNRYLYYPRAGREQCVRDATRSFIHRVFEGATLPMLVHFVKHEKLSDADVAELRKLLDDKK